MPQSSHIAGADVDGDGKVDMLIADYHAPHHIAGYTGHMPQRRERYGIGFREASQQAIAMQIASGTYTPVVPHDEPVPNDFARDTPPAPTTVQALSPDASPWRASLVAANTKPIFVPANQRSEAEGVARQRASTSHTSRAPWGIDTVSTTDYTSTATWVNQFAGKDTDCAELSQPNSLASRIAHRRVARTKRNANGGLYRPDPYDDTTIDDLAAQDPKLKILQTRSEYRDDYDSIDGSYPQ